MKHSIYCSYWGENASGRFSFTTLKDTAVETVRGWTLAGQPFANLSEYFHRLRASQRRMRL
ncbi:hypothetical protein EMIT0P176_40040 [Pseudomonas sp. IT-P176]